MVWGFSRFALFLFLGLLKSTYEEQSRKGPRHNLESGPFLKKWETPRVWKPPGLASLKPECTKIAHRRSLAIFHRSLGYRKEFRVL